MSNSLHSAYEPVAAMHRTESGVSYASSVSYDDGGWRGEDPAAGHHTPSDTTGDLQDSGSREQVWTALSAMYGTVLITVLGVAIPIGAQLANINQDDETRVDFEAFSAVQCVIYIIAILFLVYVFVYRQLQKRFWNDDFEREDDERKSEGKKRRRAVIIEETGSFYLRLGALVFGLGSLILCVLEAAWLTETSGACNWPALQSYYVVQGIFFFLQMYFIFENSQLCISRFRPLLQFGLMHVAATNILSWLWTLRTESFFELAELYHHNLEHADSHHEDDGNTTAAPHFAYRAMAVPANDSHPHHPGATPEDCEWQDIEGYELFLNCSGQDSVLGPLVVTMIPYLYPCIIEFTLIGGSLMFILWLRHGKPRYISRREADESKSALMDMKEAFASTTKGLFLGLIFLTATTVSLILFTAVLDQIPETILFLTHITEAILHAVTLAAVLAAWYLMADLGKTKHQSSNLDSALLYVALSGQIFFYALSVVASAYVEHETRAYNVVNSGVGLVQAVTQAMFIFDVSGRQCVDHEQHKRKPGRELVTFLLVTNFALWSVNVFQNQKADYNPIQTSFFGEETWILLTRLCQPLAIFFRFHSTVCLVDIWLEAYELHQPHHHHDHRHSSHIH